MSSCYLADFLNIPSLLIICSAPPTNQKPQNIQKSPPNHLNSCIQINTTLEKLLQCFLRKIHALNKLLFQQDKESLFFSVSGFLCNNSVCPNF